MRWGSRRSSRRARSARRRCWKRPSRAWANATPPSTRSSWSYTTSPRRPSQAGLPDGPLTGVPFLLKDSRLVARRRQDSAGQPLLRRPAAGCRGQPPRHAPQAGRHGDLRQDEQLRARPQPHLRAPALRPLAQSRGTWSGHPPAPAAVLRRPWRHACCRSPMPRTDSARSARRRPPAAWSACARRGRATPWRPTSANRSAGSPSRTRSRSRSGTARRCSMRPPGLRQGDPYIAPPPARPFLDEVGADPGTLRIAVTSTAPNDAPVAADPLRVLQETASLCADLGHRVDEADPAIDRRRRGADLPHHQRHSNPLPDSGSSQPAGRRSRAIWRPSWRTRRGSPRGSTAQPTWRRSTRRTGSAGRWRRFTRTGTCCSPPASAHCRRNSAGST